MEQSRMPKEPEEPPMGLLDMHTSVLAKVVESLPDAASVCALARTSSLFRDLTSQYNWQALCRSHWGITQINPNKVRCMDADLIHGYAKIDSVADATIIWEQRRRGDPWRNIFRDRTYGWRIVIKMLRWLRMHCHPTNVSGVSHRFQLYLALNYMDMCTCTTEEEARSKEIVQYEGVPSLVALLATAHPIFRTQAAAVLANLMFENTDMQERVAAESFQGKKFSDWLETEPSHLTQQMSRALVNMWATSPVPQVCLYDSEAEPAVVDLRAGMWELQEFSLRGEVFTSVTVLLSFGNDGQVFGGGTEDIGNEQEDEFVIEGAVRNGQKWELTKTFYNQHKVVYKGFSDMHGAYGVYYSDRDRDPTWSFRVSLETAPRVFRLFRRPGSAELPQHRDPIRGEEKRIPPENFKDMVCLVQEMWAGAEDEQLDLLM
mmetsp:Transcript_34951/g.99090  ORF Transcript_34951/g.99090 Transcript_34951/m.99090 type:complete len:431 (-) Transcript_34951:1059-2351(-)